MSPARPQPRRSALADLRHPAAPDSGSPEQPQDGSTAAPDSGTTAGPDGGSTGGQPSYPQHVHNPVDTAVPATEGWQLRGTAPPDYAVPAAPQPRSPGLPHSGSPVAPHHGDPVLPQSRTAPPPDYRSAAAPKYLTMERKDARLRPDQVEALEALLRRVKRARHPDRRQEPLTDSTLIRVAVDLLLVHADRLLGDTEDQLRASVLPPPPGRRR